MNETDDRLVGDPVWELFAPPIAGAVQQPASISRYLRWPLALASIALGWFFWPPLVVVTVGLVVAARDFQNGRGLTRSVPSKAGGTICARFSYAWGAWKLGVAAVVLMFASIAAWQTTQGEPPAMFIASLFLAIIGFSASAMFTAGGLLAAFRTGMRVWIGEGVNRARMLLLGMLVVGFTFSVIGPTCLWLCTRFPRAADSRTDSPGLVLLYGCMFVGPLIILIVLDWISRRVIADRPGKFGPKVPTVGKWNSPGGWAESL
jgi:hypothetical protein